jgi:transcriptional regulator with XRE-family HTH domain
MTIPVEKLFQRWTKKPGFKRHYEALEEQYALANTLIGARVQAGLSQVELAKKMGTSQSSIARLESGRVRPSLSTLIRLAKATGTALHISLEPKKPRPRRERKRAA